MMHFRLKYKVVGHMSFLSHLEMMRLWQRALMRSGLPIAWSQGFNPRPKLSLGSAKGVGIEGLGEYIDMEFKTFLKAEEVMNALNDVLPEEVRVCDLREISSQTKLLEAIINEAVYEITFEQGLPKDIEEKLQQFMAAESVLFLRRSPKKDKELDLRAFVYQGEIKDGVLFLWVKTGTGGSVRPGEILTALGYGDGLADIAIVRKGLYIREGNQHLQP